MKRGEVWSVQFDPAVGIEIKKRDLPSSSAMTLQTAIWLG
jgi:hypothetical protein